MAAISVGDAVGEGFSLIRRKPMAVGAWALVFVALLAVRVALYVPFYGALFGRVMQNVHAGASSPPDMTALMPQIQQLQAIGLLLSLLQLLVNAVVSCAIFRAVLHPDQDRLAYMRVGAAELFLVVFTIALFIAFVIGGVIVAMPLALIGGLVGMSSPVAAAGFAFLAVLCVVIAGIYLALRLSLLGPMMVDQGQFRLGEAWSLTRGKVGSLFLIGLLLFVVVVVAELVLFGVAIGVFGAVTGGFSQVEALFKAPPAEVLAHLLPVLVVGGLGWLALVVAMLPVMNAPWARAYRDLKQTDLAATFG